MPSFLVAALHLLWAAYRNEYGSPLKAFEYMAMGKPGVAAGVGQAVEPLEASGSGTAVGIGRRQELADAAAAHLFLPPQTTEGRWGPRRGDGRSRTGSRRRR